ncbi:MAG: tRNA pseudouridine(55) synthase TruB [Coriobacteriia bacterium]|nr:tRNA pseudouridine(55) synthase TruB [Coriobacteriia bacterium]
MSGVLLVDKPAGPTSHDVVARVRRATGERRVGHAGTLDPMATGLLVVLVGPATRLAPWFTSGTKTYQAVIAFGAETDTDDSEGEIVRRSEVSASALCLDEARAVATSFIGCQSQVPPAFSAIKKEGVVAHRAARKGNALELEPREIEVHRFDVISVDTAEAFWNCELEVSKGTYVRAIARDVGRRCGSAAHLAALRRTRSGACDICDACSLDEIEAASCRTGGGGTEGTGGTGGAGGGVGALFADPLAVLSLPIMQVSSQGAERVGVGAALDCGIHCEGGLLDTPSTGEVALARGDALLGIYQAFGPRLNARTVIPGGVRASGDTDTFTAEDAS